MSDNTKRCVIWSYNCLCITATLGMLIYCVLQYVLNKDVSIIDFKEFREKADFIYPTITLCFPTNFLEHKLLDNEKGIDVTSYRKFLIGEYWQDNMLDVDFDNVTTRIEDYFIGVSIWSFYSLDSGWVEYRFDKINAEFKPTVDSDLRSFVPRVYTSFRDIHEKCLSFDIPSNLDINVNTFELLFNTSIFPDGIRPEYSEFGVKIHYPNQLLTSRFAKYSWRKQTKNHGHYTMDFKLQNIMVMNQRDKPNKPCNKNWRNDDRVIMRNVMNRIGCRPPHWKIEINLPNCSKKEELKQFYYLDLSDQNPPCKGIQKVLYSYEDLDYLVNYWFDHSKETNGNNTFFNIMIEFADPYFMEIKHVRSFSAQSLIGNAGGYVGLFTGYALLQLPRLIFLMIKCMHEKENRRPKTNAGDMLRKRKW